MNRLIWKLSGLSYGLILMVLVTSVVVSAHRYRYCSEGCCPNEFCAFHLICYPKMHCAFGCPDGQCWDGLCFPHKPCSKNSECKFAHSCSKNFNLGYDICQYNLEIGQTLCVDREGNSLLKPLS